MGVMFHQNTIELALARALAFATMYLLRKKQQTKTHTDRNNK